MNEINTEQFENFRIVKYRFVLQPADFIKLSNFPGSSIRKIFLPVFKQLTCENPQIECKKCYKEEKCPFFVAVESENGFHDPDFKRYHTPPKPFIFDSPLRKKIFYTKNNKLYFDLILIGKTINYFPYFIATMRQIGEVGIGLNQGKYSLQKILALNLLDNTIAGEFDFNSENRNADNKWSFSLKELYDKYESEHEDIDEVTVSLVTPLRMKRLGNENWHLYFRTLTKNILTRIANLAIAYCDYNEILHFDNTIYRAGAVKIAKESLLWDDWRNSELRKRKPDSRMGGYYGNITYKGNIKEFWPILRIGEILHVGKNTTFGLGRIVIDAYHEDI